MNRRRLLAASASGLVGGVGGCLSGRDERSASTADATESSESNGERGTERGAEPDGVLRFVGVYAAEADREFIDGEYVVLENGSDDPVAVSGYVVEYPGDRQHRIEDLTLEPGAQLALVNDRGEDSTLLSSPPIYLRYTGPADDGERDAGAPAPELGENGTVRVTDGGGGTIVTEARYEKFGCDGGTVTTAAGDEIECLHPA